MHFLLGFITYGVWWLVWLGIALFGGERRELHTVDVTGNVSVQRVDTSLGDRLRRLWGGWEITPLTVLKWIGVAAIGVVVLFVGSAVVVGIIEAIF